jgi:hypothetical protein
MSLLLPAVAMMLGWGLRGFIGGGPLGAMIPGAMVALAICLTRGITPSSRACAFGAIAIGFGGDMTYGQTVGAAVAAETRAWGLLGLTVKGAVWGMLGGAVLRLGFSKIAPKTMALIGIVLSVAGWVGWKLINQPKVIYFSNRLDRPREEVWAGLLLAALVLVLWQPMVRAFAAWGSLGGGLGFGLGGALQFYVIQYFGREHPWWKGMEFTFGFLFGLALAIAARQLPRSDEPEPPADSLWQNILTAIALEAYLISMTSYLPLRFGFLVTGMFTLWMVREHPPAAWQLGLTVPVAAALFDLVEIGKPSWQAALAVAASVVVSVAVARFVNCAASGLLVLTWATTTISMAKFFVQGARGEDLVRIAFILMAVAVTWMLRRAPAYAP